MAVVVLDCILIHCIYHFLLISQHVADILHLQNKQALICWLFYHFLKFKFKVVIFNFSFIFEIDVFRRILITNKSPWFANWMFILRFKYLSFKVKLSWLKLFLSENLENVNRRVLCSHQSILKSNYCAVWNEVGFVDLFGEASELFRRVVLILSFNIVWKAFNKLLVHLDDIHTAAIERFQLFKIEGTYT